MSLRQYADDQPGITRRKQGRGFRYYGPDGGLIRCAQEKARIDTLAVPPAYEDVWISPHPNNYLLATGRDEKGRKQYIYHEKWRTAREIRKYANLAEFGAALPRLRRWIASRLREGDASKDAAIATVLGLIERGSLRPGSPSYTRENASYGATTLLPRHFSKDGQVSVLSYPAKGGKAVEKRVQGARLAQILAEHKRRANPKLIMWRDGKSQWRAVRPIDLNDRLAALCGDDASVKSLRTWNGTLAAFRIAQDMDRLTKKAMAEAAAEALHNTPAIAKASYIHPQILRLSELAREDKDRHLAQCVAANGPGFRSGEGSLLALLRQE